MLDTNITINYSTWHFHAILIKSFEQSKYQKNINILLHGSLSVRYCIFGKLVKKQLLLKIDIIHNSKWFPKFKLWTDTVTFSLVPTWNRQLLALCVKVSVMFSWLMMRMERWDVTANVIGWMGGAWMCSTCSFQDHFRFLQPRVSSSIPPKGSRHTLNEKIAKPMLI